VQFYVDAKIFDTTTQIVSPLVAPLVIVAIKVKLSGDKLQVILTAGLPVVCHAEFKKVSNDAGSAYPDPLAPGKGVLSYDP
jgi:hypothetical protein